MRALIFGADGQLGRALVATAPPGVPVTALSRAQCDITDAAAVDHWVNTLRASDLLVINAAAYTAVDRAETESDLARRINVDGARNIARATDDFDFEPWLIHVSTDFVFDGQSGTPYQPNATPNPLSVYGQTKRDGEEEVLNHCHMSTVIRTSWVYAAKGHNFVNTMLRLMRERDEVRVVADQIGTPTHAASLARAIWNEKLLDSGEAIIHWTDAGVASWYDFAVAIQEEALALGLLQRSVPIIPIATAEYPTPARRPTFSVLDKSATWAITGPARHWRHELIDCLKDLTA